MTASTSATASAQRAPSSPHYHHLVWPSTLTSLVVLLLLTWLILASEPCQHTLLPYWGPTELYSAWWGLRLLLFLFIWPLAIFRQQDLELDWRSWLGGVLLLCPGSTVGAYFEGLSWSRWLFMETILVLLSLQAWGLARQLCAHGPWYLGLVFVASTGPLWLNYLITQELGQQGTPLVYFSPFMGLYLIRLGLEHFYVLSFISTLPLLWLASYLARHLKPASCT